MLRSAISRPANGTANTHARSPARSLTPFHVTDSRRLWHRSVRRHVPRIALINARSAAHSRPISTARAPLSYIHHAFARPAPSLDGVGALGHPHRCTEFGASASRAMVTIGLSRRPGALGPHSHHRVILRAARPSESSPATLDVRKRRRAGMITMSRSCRIFPPPKRSSAFDQTHPTPSRLAAAGCRYGIHRGLIAFIGTANLCQSVKDPCGSASLGKRLRRLDLRSEDGARVLFSASPPLREANTVTFHPLGLQIDPRKRKVKKSPTAQADCV